MLTGIIVVCHVFYSSYNPFDMRSYKTFVYTKSEVQCVDAANAYHKGTSFPIAYDLNKTWEKEGFEKVCGPEGKYCKSFEAGTN
jgi:hypothetical protein